MIIPDPLPPRRERLQLALTADQARNILWGDALGYRTVSDEQCGHRRWSVDHYLVIQRESDGLLFADSYSVGATESQDERAWNDSPPDFRQVWPRERVSVEYV